MLHVLANFPNLAIHKLPLTTFVHICLLQIQCSSGTDFGSEVPLITGQLTHPLVLAKGSRLPACFTWTNLKTSLCRAGVQVQALSA